MPCLLGLCQRRNTTYVCCLDSIPNWNQPSSPPHRHAGSHATALLSFSSHSGYLPDPVRSVFPTMQAIFNAPEIVILVFQSCDGVRDGLSLASTCTFLA